MLVRFETSYSQRFKNLPAEQKKVDAYINYRANSKQPLTDDSIYAIIKATSKMVWGILGWIRLNFTRQERSVANYENLERLQRIC